MRDTLDSNKLDLFPKGSVSAKLYPARRAYGKDYRGHHYYYTGSWYYRLAESYTSAMSAEMCHY